MRETQQQDEEDMSTHFCLVGNISGALHALVSHYDIAFQQAREAISLKDLQLLFAVAFLPHYILKVINNRILNKTIRRKHPLAFEETRYLMPLCKIVCQVGRLSLFVYFGEVFIVFLSGLGVDGLQEAPRLLASAVYTLWAAKTVAQFVTTIVKRTCTQQCSQRTLMIRVISLVIYGIMALLFLDANDFDVGMAMTSILTLGGVSSMVVGYALKDPMTEIVLGTNLLLNDKFRVGDVVRLPTSVGDSVNGKVKSVEWTDVVLEGNDGSIVRLPHSQLAKMRIVNMSRMEESSVSQKLTVANKGQVKIERLLGDISHEIRNSCPKLIPPCQVNLVDTTDGTNVVINIETHYDIPRLSDEYNENRQTVILTINRAVLKYNASGEKKKAKDDGHLSRSESSEIKKELEAMLSAFKEEQLNVLNAMKLQLRGSPAYSSNGIMTASMTSSGGDSTTGTASAMAIPNAGCTIPSAAVLQSPTGSMDGGGTVSTPTLTGMQSPQAGATPSPRNIVGTVPSPPLYQRQQQAQQAASQPLPMSPQPSQPKPPQSPEANPFDMF